MCCYCYVCEHECVWLNVQVCVHMHVRNRYACVCSCLCRCMWVCAWMCVIAYASVYMCTRQRTISGVSSGAFHLILWDRVLTRTWGSLMIGWLTDKPQRSNHFYLPNTGITNVHHCTWWRWTWASRVCSKPLADRAVSSPACAHQRYQSSALLSLS